MSFLDGVSKRDVAFWAGLAGTAASISALSYIAWQHKKNQDSFAKQDASLAVLRTETRAIESIDTRLRNLEIAQCASAQVQQNPQLAQILNCPRPQAPTMPQAPPPVGPVGPISPVGAMAQYQQSAMPAMRQAPVLPNYGFFGDGPSGTGSHGSNFGGTMGPGMMGAFATDMTSLPVPFK
jgi:hypothetical protein